MNCYEDQATFKSYIKDFMKKVIAHMEKEGKSKEDVDAFKKKIQVRGTRKEDREIMMRKL